MILVTGSLAFDQILDFPGNFSEHILPDKIHQLNISFLADLLHKSFGGTAGNIAYTLSLLAGKCAILGLCGSDFGEYRKFLVKHKIETGYIKTIGNLYSSMAFGITDKKDNQIWGFYTGADSLSENLSIKEVKEKIDFGIIAPHNPKAMMKFACEYQERKIPYLFDPGMQLPHLSVKDLETAFKGAKIIIGNDYEMELIRKRLDFTDIEILVKGDKIIITTLGEKGSEIECSAGSIRILPAGVARIEDPTGAGDAYRAGFIAGFVRGLTLETCGQMGSVASAYTVEKYGTTTHHFTIEEFTKRYKENFGKDIKL